MSFLSAATHLFSAYKMKELVDVTFVIDVIGSPLGHLITEEILAELHGYSERRW